MTLSLGRHQEHAQTFTRVLTEKRMNLSSRETFMGTDIYFPIKNLERQRDSKIIGENFNRSDVVELLTRGIELMHG
jgi:hypothetical protein